MRMTRVLAHRGPDAEGFAFEGPIALGHRRLSIIDLAGGGQPMFSPDHSLVVVFNGEIYNYRELRAELSGHRFRTDSDTEVLLHLYGELGEGLCEKLRGMFAFALWDVRKQKLVAARDRFGEKPLLYADEAGKLTFASELRALVAGIGTREIDREALSDYLELLYVPAPRTIYRGVRKLPAGSLLIADAQGVRVRRYWSPPVPGSETGSAAASEPGGPASSDPGGAAAPVPASELAIRLRKSLRDAVRLRLRSDVPIAALLSGGIDSSVVVALMAQELGPGVKTFSVGFGRTDDELPFARAVAERWQTEHHEIQVTSELVVQVAEGLGAYGEPFGDSSAVPTVAVCKEVAKEVKVVLTGDGGDELFAGYGLYRRLARIPHVPQARAVASVFSRLPASRFRSRARRLLRASAARPEDRQRALIEVFPAAERRELLGGARESSFQFASADGADAVDAALAFDLGVYLPDDLLQKTDIASMRWGLEARCPLLDHDLAALVVPPPVRMKQTRSEGKLLLREAAADLLPEAILQRPKRGFGSPVEQWLAGPLRPMAEDLLRDPKARIRGWLDGAAVDRVLEEVLSGRGNGHQGWALLALEVWARG